LLDTGKRVVEIPIPTYYGEEISRVNGIRYGLLILKTSLLSRFVPHGILYDPKFDYAADGTQYTPKLGFSSSHEFALARVEPETTVLDIGCGPGFMAEALSTKHVKLISIDLVIHPKARQFSTQTIEANIEDFDFGTDFGPVCTILLLDIIEHLRHPEALLFRLRERYGQDRPQVIITTGNIGFFVVRFGLLLGQFNYGKRGILDMDHTRLFTFSSLRRALVNAGYEILERKGVPPPYPLAIGDNKLARLLLAINRFLMFFSKGLFAYQMAFVARPLPTLEHLFQDAQTSSQERITVYDQR
jgi:SAM-dependent methyltransferase